MKTFFVQIVTALATLAFLSENVFAFTENGRLQVGRYEMQYSSEVPVIDALEILPNQKFRFWDRGTQKDTFFFEGSIQNIQKLEDQTYSMDLIVERDGRLMKGKVLPRESSDFNLRLRKMTLKIFEKSFSTTVIFKRDHSYRGNEFWTQERMSDVEMEGQIENFNFMGFPIDY